MAHTLEPWTTKYKMVRFFGTIDDAELAARLGSKNTFDRLGRVLFIDGFNENITNWGTASSGEGSYICRSTDTPHKGASCAYLRAGSDSLRYATLIKTFYTPTNTKIGVEWNLSGKSSIEYIQLECAVFDGTRKYENRVRLNYSSDDIEIWTASGTTAIPDNSFSFVENEFYYIPVKLTIDPTTNHYDKLRVAYKTWDLSDYVPYDRSNSSGPFIQNSITVFSISGNNAEIRIDSFILTQDEP